MGHSQAVQVLGVTASLVDTLQRTPLPRLGSHTLPFQAQSVKFLPAWDPSSLLQSCSRYLEISRERAGTFSAALALEAICATRTPWVSAPENPECLALLKTKHRNKLINPDSKDYLGVRLTPAPGTLNFCQAFFKEVWLWGVI